MKLQDILKKERAAYNKAYYQKNYLCDIWRKMIRRCYNPKDKSYKNYGGRGIKVCDKWKNSFENFKNDVGERPSPDHSIDRVFNGGDYKPGNVKWSTREEQGQNKRPYAKGKDHGLFGFKRSKESKRRMSEARKAYLKKKNGRPNS